MTSPTIRSALLMSLVLATCQSGVLGDGDGAPDAGGGDGGGGEGGTACSGMVCNPGEVCVAGRCLAPDGCDGVICDNPGEICVDGACVAGAADDDGDGYRAAEDCDDSNAAVNPGALEVCNGIDDDCDHAVDEDFDADSDGYTTCGGGDPSLADCDDAAAGKHPGAEEQCNEVDDDCDGEIDEGIPGLGDGCGSSVGACRQGVMGCVHGELRCVGSQDPRPERCDTDSDLDCDGAPGCADSDCETEPCGGDGRCFGGDCATPCETHNDGSVDCSTLCGWCRGSCRGAVRDTGEIVGCGHRGDPMWCYCVF